MNADFPIELLPLTMMTLSITLSFCSPCFVTDLPNRPCSIVHHEEVVLKQVFQHLFLSLALYFFCLRFGGTGPTFLVNVLLMLL